MFKAIWETFSKGKGMQVTNTDLIKNWIKWRESGLHQVNWSENTKQTYIPYLKQFLKIHPVLTANTVESWLSNIPQEQYSKRRHNHSALSSFARFQMEKGHLDKTEYLKIRNLYPKRSKYHKPKQLIINETQLSIILKKAQGNSHRYQRILNITLLILLSETGLRVSEACNLCLDDFTFSDIGSEAVVIVRLGKGGKARKVPFTRKAQKAVKEYLKHRPANTAYKNLFLGFGPNTGYQPLDRHAVARRFQAISEKAGVPFTSHSLRYYAITNWGKRLSSPIVKKLAGHSSLSVTERYIHIQEEEALMAAFE